MKKKILIVVANYYNKIALDLLSGAELALKGYRVPAANTITVPGTFEIPVVISNLIDKYDAFVALGCVIKGQTPHFHYICSSVITALTNLSIKSKKPIGNGILTCDNKKQAIKRADKDKSDKGGNAADAVISVFNIIN